VNGHDTSTSSDCLVSWVRHARAVALWMTASYLVVAPLVFALQGQDGLVAAGIAALVCAAATISAQFTAIWLAGAGQPFHATLIAMLLRMAPPLVFCMAIGFRRGPLTDAGAVFYVIGFYMVTLAVDTWLSVGRISLASLSRKG
jgi:hypothetical protein